MKFIIGSIPHNSGFNPELEKWKALKEPSIWMYQLIGIFIGIIVVIFLGFFWYVFADIKSFRVELDFWIFFWITGSVIIHELIHAAFHPGYGTSSNTYLGFWPSKLIFYAHYHSTLSKYRFMAVLISPFIFISIVPLIICTLFHYNSTEVCIITSFNTLAASGDIFGFLLIFFGVPSGAIVQNKGWKTYYKTAEQVTTQDPGGFLA